MDSAYRRSCGIDVHRDSLTVCVLAPADKPHLGTKKLTFKTFTRDLKQMRKWLLSCRVTQVAMESTGQYWRGVWNVLEGHVRLVLVNPQHIKGIEGQKTDPGDSEWLATLLDKGMLKGSFVPPAEIREMRDLLRHRVHLLEEINRVKNRMEQVCQSGNIKISSVASDLLGTSGRRMLRGLIEGRRDPGWMADYAMGRLREKRKELERALEGTLSEQQRALLGRLLKELEWLESEVSSVEVAVAARMEPHQELLTRLVTIPGIDRITAWTLVAELGPDERVFGSASRLASWCGLCPGNRESGGKRLSGRTRHANRYVRRVMCQAAWAASHTKRTFLSAYYRRIRVRRGHQRAVVALAHKLICIVYEVFRGEVYREIGDDYYDQRDKGRITRRLVHRLQQLGYGVLLRPVTDEGGAGTQLADSAGA